MRFVILVALCSVVVASGCAGSGRRYTGDGGFVPFLFAAFSGPRVGFQMNEGSGHTGWETVRIIPYISTLPGIIHGVAASGGMTNYQYLHDNDLVAPARDASLFFLMDELAKRGQLTPRERKPVLRDLALVCDYPCLASLQAAHMKGDITEAEFAREIGTLVDRMIRNNPGQNWALDPLNRGLLLAAMKSGAVKKEDAGKLCWTVLQDSDQHDPYLIAEAEQIGAIDSSAATTMLRRLYLRRAEQIVDEAGDNGGVSGAPRDKMLSDIRAELSRVEQQVSELLMRHTY